MHNTASLLVLVFLVVTFIQSGYDKVFHWKENVEWLKSHFANSIIKNHVPLSLGLILVLELISGIFSSIGCIELLINGGKTFGFYGAVFSSITLIFLLLGPVSYTHLDVYKRQQCRVQNLRLVFHLFHHIWFVLQYRCNWIDLAV